MSLEWAARIALAMYGLYTVAFYAEVGAKSERTMALRVLNFGASVAILTALIWAGWWS